MKKIFAMLCALLLLLASCASAEGGTVVSFRECIELNGTLPEGWRFSLVSQTDLTLEGEIISGDSAAPVLQVYIAFNESYAQAGSLKDIDTGTVELIKQGFSEEYAVTFDSFETASGDSLLLIRETGGRFLDFYTVSLGHEIELTLVPGESGVLTDAQISRCLEFMRTLDVLPIHG